MVGKTSNSTCFTVGVARTEETLGLQQDEGIVIAVVEECQYVTSSASSVCDGMLFFL